MPKPQPSDPDVAPDNPANGAADTDNPDEPTFPEVDIDEDGDGDGDHE